MPVKVPFFVEGETDQAFLRIALERAVPEVARAIEVRNGKGRDNLLKALAAEPPPFLGGAALDMDDTSADAVLQRVRDYLASYWGADARLVDQFVVAGDRRVFIVPMGLPAAQLLQEWRIGRHALEDYLMKIILEDGVLTSHVPGLHAVLREAVDSARRHNIAIDSSEEFMQLAKPLLHMGKRYQEVVEAIAKNAHEKILSATLADVVASLKELVQEAPP